MATSSPTPLRCSDHHSLYVPPALSGHLLCSEGPADHEVPASHVREVYVPVSTDERDGHRDLLLALCSDPGCQRASLWSARCHVGDDRHIGPIRPLTVSDVHSYFGVELTAPAIPCQHVTVQAAFYGRWDVLIRDGTVLDGARVIARWRHDTATAALDHAALLRHDVGTVA